MIVEDEGTDEENDVESGPCHRRRVLVSKESADLLQNAGKGSLGI